MASMLHPTHWSERWNSVEIAFPQVSLRVGVHLNLGLSDSKALPGTPASHSDGPLVARCEI